MANMNEWPGFESWWGLLQVTDSAFPTGAFAHSFGLETLVQEGIIESDTTAREWIRAGLLQAWAPTDGLATLLVWAAMHNAEDVDVALTATAAIDARLTASRSAEEVREGSLQVGRRFLDEVYRLTGHRLLDAYKEQVQQPQNSGLGNPSVAFGLMGALWGWPQRMTAMGAGYWALSGAVSAMVKLVPLGQSTGQRILWEMAGPLKASLEGQRGRTLEDLGAALPAWDIAALRHPYLYSRLFRS